MSTVELLLIIHLLAAMTWFGGELVGVLIGMSLRKRDDLSGLGQYCISFASVAGPVFGGSSLVLLGTGLGIVGSSDAIAFGDTWVIAALVGWLLITVMGATAVGSTWLKVGTELDSDGADQTAAGAIADRAIRLTWIDVALKIGLLVLVVAGVSS